MKIGKVNSKKREKEKRERRKKDRRGKKSFDRVGFIVDKEGMKTFEEKKEARKEVWAVLRKRLGSGRAGSGRAGKVNTFVRKGGERR